MYDFAWIVAGIAACLVVQWIDRIDHRRETEAIHASYAKVLDAQANLRAYGQARLPVAETTEAEPQPEERAQHAVTEAMVERGFLAMRSAYNETGLGDHLSDDEIRDEVRSMIHGAVPRPPRVLDGLLPRD